MSGQWSIKSMRSAIRIQKERETLVSPVAHGLRIKGNMKTCYKLNSVHLETSTIVKRHWSCALLKLLQ